ncbi:cathepsin B-like protein 2 [Sarcoptes scabiei]|uniref:Cathepsin B-like protein 2 n=1 Tax=Sarcoptes scabiei TaxID=52283 RepID=A0A132AG04_SARSC|nr:cathepsin B-like protein 2 [Sarcoptes scabiei]
MMRSILRIFVLILSINSIFSIDEQFIDQSEIETVEPFEFREQLSNQNAILSQEFINEINLLNASWKAGNNFHPGTTVDQIKMLLGVKPTPKHLQLPMLVRNVGASVHLPKQFDARKQWPKCRSIRTIRDQGSCGSCWAFGAAEAISDRVCIASNAKFNTLLSAEDILSCCDFCGDGCHGGFPSAAWMYFVKLGVVTGGLYGDKRTCQPYYFPPCEHHMAGPRPPCGSIKPTPRCKKHCTNSHYNVTFSHDKHYGRVAYRLSSNQYEIMYEIMTHGPVEAAFQVYADFAVYKSGVYVRRSNQFMGGHAIRVLGWGVDSKTRLPYWLCANSWNTDWGENGYFKILRGVNECNIEGQMVGGLPKF